MTHTNTVILITLIASFFSTQILARQDIPGEMTSRSVSIPNVIDIHGTPAHLFVLSETEGMAVFRAKGDSLQWLYTSSGMQRRGDRLDGDIRFSYLFGNGSRLSVLEPTSVLGVFSSTQLPHQLRGAARMGNFLYLAMGAQGLGRLSLSTPESVDSDPETVFNQQLQRHSVLDVISSVGSSQLFVLTDDQKIHIFSEKDESASLSGEISLNMAVTDLFSDGDRIWGATANNEVHEIFGDGSSRSLGSVDGMVTDILNADGSALIRSKTGSLWLATPTRKASRIRSVKDQQQIAKADNTIWIHSFGTIAPFSAGSTSPQGESELKIRPLTDQIITFPEPLLLDLQLDAGLPENTSFSYRSPVTNARIRDQGFFWQPSVNQVGFHWFTLIAHSADGAVDSTRFSVEVRSFNSPPRFSPLRNTSIAVNERYELSINATDPESQGTQLIRYIGVDMPDGATIDERSGLFSWTPAPRQVGTHTFKVIATDKKGAAAAQEITIKVLDISRGGEN